MHNAWAFRLKQMGSLRLTQTQLVKTWAQQVWQTTLSSGHSLDGHRLRCMYICIANDLYEDPMIYAMWTEVKSVSLWFPLFKVLFQCWRPANWADFVFGAWLWPQSSHWAWTTSCCGLLPWTVPYRQGWLCRHLAGSGFTRYLCFC